MFEKVAKCAEGFAVEIPRREFFGRVARTAMPLATAIAGFWTLSSHAAPSSGGRLCCDSSGDPKCKRQGKACPDGLAPCSAPGGPFEGFNWIPCSEWR